MIEPSISPIISPIASGIIGGGVSLDSALVNLDERGIVGSSPVTAWNNSGAGGSPFSPDIVLGTGANLTRITLGGHDAVNSSGSAGLETTAGQTLSGVLTIYMVAKVNALTGVAQFFSAAKSLASSSPQLQTSGSDAFRFNAGSSISPGAGDTDLHLHIVRYNKDSTTSYEVDGVGIAIGDAGSEDYEWGTLFASISAGSTVDGGIAQFTVFDLAHTNAQVADVKSQLTQKFAL